MEIKKLCFSRNPQTFAKLVFLTVLPLLLSACAQLPSGQSFVAAQDIANSLNREKTDQQTEQLLSSLSYSLQQEIDSDTASISKNGNDGVLITISGDDAFRTGHARLNNTILSVLDKLTQTLILEKENVVHIVSHTDNVGSDEVNQSLSERRANAVASHLQRQGLKANRISSIGRGESEPLVSNDEQLGQSVNRRLEIFVLTTPDESFAATEFERP